MMIHASQLRRHRLVSRWSIFVCVLVVVASTALLSQTNSPAVFAVENVASYGNGSLSPGEMVVIFGTALGPSQLTPLQLDSQGRLVTTLAGVQVLFDGIPAPLIYASQTQLCAMAPYGLNGNSITQIQVAYQGVKSAAFSKTITTAAPGIFSADSSGKGLAAAANSDGSFNSQTNPATPGSYITFYLTGEGLINPPGSDGSIANATTALTLPITVTIAGQNANVLYAGSAPGNVFGFAQVNAVVPANLAYGGNLPLLVQIGGNPSQTELTIAVSGPAAPIPGTPQGLSAALGLQTITLAWTLPDASAQRLHVERNSNAGSFSEIAVLAAPVISYADHAVSAGIQYSYRIRAENNYGFSPYSNAAGASLPVLSPPSNVQASPSGANTVQITWSAAGTNATQFQLERKTLAGLYSQIVTVASTTTSYLDGSLAANTTYTYRILSLGLAGASAYSSESAATTAVGPPPAPTLQASALSSSQILLTWSTAATGIIRFHLERRTSTTSYVEISQPAPSLLSVTDTGLLPATSYFYRLGVETAGGLSAYSNEVTATTPVPLQPPSNVTILVISTSEIDLSWTNPTVPFLRTHIERGTPVSAYSEIASVSSSSTTYRDVGVVSSTTYFYRLRTEDASGFSSYSTALSVSTPASKPPLFVFLVHGIGGSSADSAKLAQTLLDPVLGITVPATLNWGFTWPCAKYTIAQCDATCTIPQGADSLAQYILANSPAGSRIAIIGHSMGGLLARDMILNNALSIASTRSIVALITLGTPNVGYPFVEGLDDSATANSLGITLCPALGQEMYSDWRALQSQNLVLESPYLNDLNSRWGTVSLSQPFSWLAAAGTFCTNPLRSSLNPVGCSDNDPNSDGVVCEQSARVSLALPKNLPTTGWSSNLYAHTSSLLGTRYVSGPTLLCTTDSLLFDYIPLYDPPASSALVTAIRSLVNGLQ